MRKWTPETAEHEAKKTKEDLASRGLSAPVISPEIAIILEPKVVKKVIKETREEKRKDYREALRSIVKTGRFNKKKGRK